jgi:hypothetical protein
MWQPLHLAAAVAARSDVDQGAADRDHDSRENEQSASHARSDVIPSRQVPSHLPSEH